MLVLAGGGSGLASTCVLTPVELVKCRLQAQLGGASAAPTQLYKGPVDVSMQVVRAEGVTGLWRGSLSMLAREVPGNMAWLGVYEAVMRTVQTSRRDEKKADMPPYRPNEHRSAIAMEAQRILFGHNYIGPANA